MTGEAEALLAEVESLRGKDPKGALRLLERQSAAFRDAFGFDGPLHAAFRTALWDLQGQLDPRRPRAAAPTVAVLSWDAVPDLAGLARAAQERTAEIIYLAPPERRRDATPMAQLAALHQFSDPRVAMVVVGDGPPILLRRALILSAIPALDEGTDIADVGQELLEFAHRSGSVARFTR